MKGAWPKIRTQHDLAEIAKLRQAKKDIYALQGKSVGEILAHYGFTDERTLDILHNRQKRPEHQKQPLGDMLVSLGAITQETLDCALYIQAGVIMVDIPGIPIPPDVAKLVPHHRMQEKQAIPVGVYNSTLFLAVADPLHFSEKSFFKVLTGLKEVEPVYAPPHEIASRLNTSDPGGSPNGSGEESRGLAQKTPAEGAASGFTLLFVDDEPDIVDALWRSFIDGYTVLTATSGKEALELLKSNKVDLIISDQRMPGMPGDEFLTQAKSMRPDAIRILLTGYTDYESLAKCVNNASIHKHASKPWEPDVLRRMVESALGQRKQAQP
jgi:CheY-like chemotaxis protein